MPRPAPRLRPPNPSQLTPLACENIYHTTLATGHLYVCIECRGDLEPDFHVHCHGNHVSRVGCRNYNGRECAGCEDERRERDDDDNDNDHDCSDNYSLEEAMEQAAEEVKCGRQKRTVA
jgi:hypothetical protein